MRHLDGTASEINRIYFIAYHGAPFATFHRFALLFLWWQRGEKIQRQLIFMPFASTAEGNRGKRSHQPASTPLAHTGLSFLCAFVCILCSGPRPPPSVPAPTPPFRPHLDDFFFVANCHEKFESRVDLKSVALCIFMPFNTPPNQPPTHPHTQRPHGKAPLFFGTPLASL